jgi:HD-like signal output (HDOD) protein
VSFDKKDIRAFVEDLQGLPTIPKVGMRIIELASDPEVSIEDLTAAMRQDPSLAARVLKVANSPFYGTARRVDSLQLAVVILGLNEVRTIALGITFFDVIKKFNPELSQFREAFWFHCAACGIISRILGRKLDVGGDGSDFIAGLLHDIGKIVIDACFSGKFVTVFNETFTHKPPMLAAEREVIGGTHEEFGCWLAEKWRLPQTICSAIAHHHTLPERPSSDLIDDPKLVALSYVAEAFCEHYELGWDGDDGESSLRREEVWDVLLSGQRAYTERDIDTILTETLQVFSEARPRLLWE